MDPEVIVLVMEAIGNCIGPTVNAKNIVMPINAMEPNSFSKYLPIFAKVIILIAM